jgi:hypothetical protein
MGGSKAQLEETFRKAVTAFNSWKKMSDFEPYLSDNAIVYSKRDHHGYHPKHAALMFLDRECKDAPNFQQPKPSDLTIDLNAAGTGATIHGTTTWKDKNGPPEQLLFTFTFVYDDDKKEWLFSTLWAA